MRATIACGLALAASLAVALPADADAKGKHKGKGHNKHYYGEYWDRDDWKRHRGRDRDRHAHYYWRHYEPSWGYAWVPQGLPPGIAKKLKPGHRLPPGLSYYAPPPPVLALVPVRPGHSYYMLDERTMILVAAGGIIADILRLD